MDRKIVEVEVEAFRQIVIASRSQPTIGPQGDLSKRKLNDLFQKNPTLFTDEDVRFVNALAGFLGERVEAHRPRTTHTRRRRKGDQLDHCWRCKTPVDERFVETCTECSSKKFAWMICPVCQACGCQRGRKVLV